jgi:hypothetical protein
MNKQINKITRLLCQKVFDLNRFFAAQDMVKIGLHEHNNESLDSINAGSLMTSLLSINIFWSEEVSNKILSSWVLNIGCKH